MAEHNGRKNFVARFGHTVERRVKVKQPAQVQKQQHHTEHDDAQCDHVFLRISQCFNRYILLHHFLIETRHRDGDEHAG